MMGILSMKRPFLLPVLFVLEAAAAASFLLTPVQSWMGMDGKLSGVPGAVLFFLLTAFLGFVLFFLVNAWTRFLSSFTPESPASLKRGILLTLAPSILLFAPALQRWWYLKDLKGPSLVLSAAGCIYLHVLFLGRLERGKSPSLGSRAFFLFRISGRPRSFPAAAAFLLPLAAYAVFASGLVFRPFPITGDEPHYLLLTKSLLEDGDIDLGNNYREQDYLEFYPGWLDTHARPGKKGPESLYSRHMPGLSLMLVPAYAAGRGVGKLLASFTGDPGIRTRVMILFIRLFLCGVTAVLCGFFYLLARRVLQRPSQALLAWGVLSFASPVLFYSHKIYPEIPASLLLLTALWLSVLAPRNNPGRLSLAGASIGLLPWLGIKYAVLAAGAWLAALWCARKSKWSRCSLLAFHLPFLLSASMMFFLIWSLHGTLSPLALYKGTALDRGLSFHRFFHAELLEWLRCGAGYFLDQRAGLFVPFPLFFLFIPGLVLWWRKERRKASLFFFPVGLYWAFCALSYYWGGYAPPGRTLLPVLWILALALSLAWEESRDAFQTALRHGLAALTALFILLSLADTRLLYHENLSFSSSGEGKTSQLLVSLSNPFLDLTRAAPSLSNRETLPWESLLLWSAAAVAIGFSFARRRRKPSRLSLTGRLSVHLAFLFAGSAFVLLLAFLHVRLEPERSFPVVGGRVYFQDQNHYGPERGGFWVKGSAGTEVVVETPEKVHLITISLSSPVPGKTSVRVGNTRRTVLRGQGSRMESTAVFSSPVGFSGKNKHLYTVAVEEEGGFVPRGLDPGSKDNRNLGVFVKIRIE